MRSNYSSLTGSRRVLAATVVSCIIFGVTLIQQALTGLLNLSIFVHQIQPDTNFERFVPAVLLGVAALLVPFVVGVFLFLWLVAPIVAELRLTVVIVRALLATLAGSILVFLITFVGFLFNGGLDTSAGLVYGWLAGAASTVTTNAGWAAQAAFYSAANFAITATPLTVLAGIVVWVWLRGHPNNGVAERAGTGV